MPRAVLRTAAVAVLIVAAAALAVLGLVVRRDEPGPPLGAVLDGDDRRALGAVPLRRGADPPQADPAVDLADPAAVARAYLAVARSSTAADHGRTRREASPYAEPGSTAAVGLVVLDPPEPGQVRTATVTALDLVAAADDDHRRGFRATVATSTGPPGGVDTTAVTTEYVVLARQPDGRWLVVADAPELLEGGD